MDTYDKYLLHFVSCLDAVECDCEKKICSYGEFVRALVGMLVNLRKRGKVFFIGNGGSAGISMHMATDFLKNGRVRTYSMHDPAILTCLANDYGYEYVFSKQVEMVAEAEDLLIAISSSGSSENILKAVKTAQERKCNVVTFSGFREKNPLRAMGECNVYVPCESYGIVESIHQLILQQVVDELMESV